MKYRIKIIEKNSGEKLYQPQKFDYTKYYIQLPFFIVFYIICFPLLLLTSLDQRKLKETIIVEMFEEFFIPWKSFSGFYITEQEALNEIEQHQLGIKSHQLLQ